MVRLYDETRIFDPGCFDSALSFLVERFPPQVFGRVFEPGIGTGRVAVPLTERGYQLTGVDISGQMLAGLRQRLEGIGRILFQQADVTELPFRDAAFDMSIAVHLFYFIRHWKKAADEVLRVVRDGGPVVLMHTGTGSEIPFLNERYIALCAEQGHSIESVGVKSTREVADYYGDLGCEVEWIRNRWEWTWSLRLDKALDYVRSRAYSFTTVPPDDVHFTAVERLESELKCRFESLATEVKVTSQVYLVIVLRR